MASLWPEGSLRERASELGEEVLWVRGTRHSLPTGECLSWGAEILYALRCQHKAQGRPGKQADCSSPTPLGMEGASAVVSEELAASTLLSRGVRLGQVTSSLCNSIHYSLNSRNSATIMLMIMADIQLMPFLCLRHTFPGNNTLVTGGSLTTQVPPSLRPWIERRLRNGKGPRAHGKYGEQSSHIVLCLQDADWKVLLLHHDLPGMSPGTQCVRS